MGYPMTYDRVVNRNHLQGDYDNGGSHLDNGWYRCNKCGYPSK